MLHVILSWIAGVGAVTDSHEMFAFYDKTSCERAAAKAMRINFASQTMAARAWCEPARETLS
jgi:hypothetical protein